jgi:hypothetical protein
MSPGNPLVPTDTGRGLPLGLPGRWTRSRARRAAHASWIAPLLIFIVGLKIKEAGVRDTTYGVLILGIVSIIFYFAGFVVAVYALSRLRTVGGLGVLAPAVVGLILNGFLLLLLGSNFVLSFHLLE